MFKLTRSYFEDEEREQREAERHMLNGLGSGSHAKPLLDLYRKAERPKEADDKRKAESDRLAKWLKGD